MNLCEEIKENDAILSCELIRLSHHLGYYHFQVVSAVVKNDLEHCKYKALEILERNAFSSLYSKYHTPNEEKLQGFSSF